MNHFCTYFDRNYLAQGLALWRSLAAHDAGASLWVLALDEFTADLLRELSEPGLKIVSLAELEAGDPALVAAKAGRSPVEYYFTLSPCWPRWLLASHPEIEHLTYVDADMFFFGPPAPIFAAMDAAGASVLVTEHRFPNWMRHTERNGRFNLGILSFRNDATGRACLDDWRERCLAWCFDRLEDGKYADQKYLDEWPGKFGPAVLVLGHAGVNLAPWNWLAHKIEWEAARLPSGMGILPMFDGLRRGHGQDARATTGIQMSPPPARSANPEAACCLRIDGQPLILFHFARFRPLVSDWWWHSGQVVHGIMPWRLRRAIYGTYWRALSGARTEVARRRVGFDFARRSARLDQESWRLKLMGVVFGSNWLRVGDAFLSGRFGLGRWSGRCIVMLLRLFSPAVLSPD